MRGEFNLKKILDIGEYMVIFFIGYLIFNLVVTIVQVILYGIFGMILDFNTTYISNCKGLSIQYFIIFMLCLISNFIYNFCIIKKLNTSLKKFKEGRIENEK